MKIKKREFALILYEILTMLKVGSTKTHIATKMGFNFKRASSRVDLLLATGHLQKHSEESRTNYVLTDKGESLLAGLASIKDSLIELLIQPRPLAVAGVGSSLTIPSEAGLWTSPCSARNQTID